MSTLLVVCTANVCRSPLAHRLLGLRLDPALGVDVASAGTRAMVDSAMCPVSAQRLAPDDPFPAAHRARQLDAAVVQGADLVVTMEREQRSVAVRAAPGSQAKVFTLREAVLLAEALEERGEERATGLPDLARRLHALRGLVVPPPPVQTRRWLRRPAEPEAPFTVVDGHGLDMRSHEAAATQVHETTDRLAELLRTRLAPAAPGG